MKMREQTHPADGVPAADAGARAAVSAPGHREGSPGSPTGSFPEGDEHLSESPHQERTAGEVPARISVVGQDFSMVLMRRRPSPP